ncbi:hypothetical protein PIB30_103042 [Stylosanthes scabra]|uniref:Uncharacterized protein n=1 Tax=Stylosanthes scabra TaxID=79078 RepID=A0ABU6VXV9_9FABA|nr:hypothetical protein [Stylosanthes scabra]
MKGKSRSAGTGWEPRAFLTRYTKLNEHKHDRVRFLFLDSMTCDLLYCEKVVINDSSNSEISKKMEVDNMELIAMDEPFVRVEEDEEEEKEEEPEEDPDKEEEGEIKYFRDEEDNEDYFSAEDDDSSDGSTGSN